MKIAGTDFHLTYCTNIHPGESWTEVKDNLQQYLPKLKARLDNRSLGIGLRLAEAAVRELLAKDNLLQFQTWLQEHDLYVFTLNGFPYGGFHHQVVKDKVYAPDWSTVERVDYTLRLIEILATLLPERLDGGISTVPLSYKPWWQDNPNGRDKTLHQSSLHLAQIAAKLAEIQNNTGKLLHLDLEPEPDAMLENTVEVINYFHDWLLPIAGNWLQQNLGISKELAESWLRNHIRVCYDTCHFAVEYEEPEDVLQKLKNAGIKIGKIQLSSAIKIDLSAETAQRQVILEKLSAFAESTYLHQVIARHGDRTLQHYADLSQALPHLATTKAQEWRTHFHVPIFIRNYQPFESTQEHLTKVLQLLPENPVCNHLEIETYTWEVLPPEMKMDILTSIEREYQWVLKTLALPHQEMMYVD
ncbi:metabolite traffic protein EboE [Myxosarcina sp. GI1]|uniref:metabolite traffic protein EboE n=1 Tax=Myxosarcina sp. GI1 TaxID=1541065 RepID=UPI00056ADE04|nr:metabolite traffic protein EboE [Myxosarcina sp. GI1]